MHFDVLIKNGLVADGSGMPAYHADVGIAGGRIVTIGKIDGHAREVVDASGSVVAPGFIDPHTHYDAQLFWDPLATPTSWHGFTSVLITNCGFGIAPVRSEEHTSELQSPCNLVCRLLLEKKKEINNALRHLLAD